MSETEAPARCVVPVHAHIAETEWRILRQEELLAELARRGWDKAGGEKLLRELWETLALLHERRRFADDRRGAIP